MNRFTPPPSGPPKVSKYRRFDWWHAKNSLPDHRRWRAISHKTGIPVGNIVAVVYCLNSCANAAHRRGSVEDFRVFECAVTLGYDPAQVQAIYDSLVETQWLQQDFIVDWFQHNPDQHDPTAAERKRRQRQRERDEREKRAGTDVSRVTVPDVSRNVTRDTPTGHAVTPVTSRPENVTRDVTLDKIRNIKSSPSVSHPQGVDNFSTTTNDNGEGGADERASAPLTGALARRSDKTDSDGLTDEGAFKKLRIDPLLGDVLKPKAVKDGEYQTWLKGLLGSPVNGKGH